MKMFDKEVDEVWNVEIYMQRKAKGIKLGFSLSMWCLLS